MVGFLDVVTFLAWVLDCKGYRGGEEAEKCGVRSEVGSRVPRSGSEWSERRRGRGRGRRSMEEREREVRRMRNREPEGKAVGGPIGASP